MCGGNPPSAKYTVTLPGLSPRVRGKLAAEGTVAYAVGSIPACAGETYGRRVIFPRLGVYPRVCGGNFGLFLGRFAGHGLSPRVRGKPKCRSVAAGGAGSIPACAGETSSAAMPANWRTVYPRVCRGNSTTSK